MKKIHLILSIVIVTLILVTSCEKDPILFDNSMSIVGFSSPDLTIGEADGSATDVVLYLGGAIGASTEVTLSVVTDGFDNPAVEGVDFTLSSTTVSLEVGEEAVQITPIDNAVFEGNKKFNLVITSNSAGYGLTQQSVITITINDDEHPLKNWIGTYDVAAPSFTVPGAWDEAWVVTTTPIEGELDKLLLTGVGLNGTGLIATLDTDAMTITIDPGQDIGLAYADWGYNVVGQDEVTVYFGYSDLSYDDSMDLVGTLQANGDMTVDGWCHIMDGAVWDVFDTSWIKR